ncbi:CDP-glycerol glycerophosphotransferase family protein [Rossellomorea aquimaris]|uniref:CDP-glycerol glycerophosphotransferase family protein n=1 Tax=Rossellomorea aquimaris TaxID=189382 RepID=UPI0005C7EF6D|nr:CDP-glycerol glycerophosphotransferase family protein [Rossellomorea aquimaris]
MVKSIKQVNKIFMFCFSLILFYLIKSIPKSKNIWVFGAWYGQKYSDNSKYLYEYINKLPETKVKTVWITKNKSLIPLIKNHGGLVYHTYSIKGLWYSARAAVTITTSSLKDVNFVASYDSVKIQLWHGTPLKKIGKDDTLYTSKSERQKFNMIKEKLFPFTKNNWDYIISPSDYVSKIFSRAFDIPLEKVLLTGYPRTDFKFSTSSELDNYISNFQGKKIILYAPTFRADSNIFLKVISKDNLIKMNRFLIKNNSVILINMHYINSEVFNNHKFKEFSNIIFVNSSILNDINELLPYTDILITDYSSIYFDYLLLDKPIIFFPFDFNQYLTKDRELYEDYNEVTPGVKCENWIDLIDQIEKTLINDEFTIERKKIRSKYFEYYDKKNSKRVYHSIQKILENYTR